MKNILAVEKYLSTNYFFGDFDLKYHHIEDFLPFDNQGRVYTFSVFFFKQPRAYIYI